MAHGGANLDETTTRLLSRLQKGVPLTPEPYETLGEEIGIPAGSVLATINALRETGIVRMIGPVMDARRLGYLTTLVAAKVKPENAAKADAVLIANLRISHAYERDHAYNIWFTLALPNEEAMEAEIEKIGTAIPAEDIFQLPATRLFKIGAFFGDGAEPETAHEPSQPGEDSGELTAEEKAVINAVQRDLPMTGNPFGEMARDAGMDVTDFLIAVRALQERGFMRRYSAAVNHRRAGYTANGMACFAVPAERQDEVGEFLANQREVSHCYIRRTNPRWNYNLFAMIHGKAKDVALDLAKEVAEQWDIKDYGVLFSTREIKKMRIRYPV